MERTTNTPPEDILCQDETQHKHLCGLNGDRDLEWNEFGCGYVWQHSDCKATSLSDHFCPRCKKLNTWRWWSTWLMATISDRATIERLIQNNGYYDKDDTEAPDNEQAQKIVEYINLAGVKVWGVSFSSEGDIDRYLIPSEYVNNPVVIWDKEHGLIREMSPGFSKECPPIGKRPQTPNLQSDILKRLLELLENPTPEARFPDLEAERMSADINRRLDVKSKVFSLPDNASENFERFYQIMSMADIEDAIILIKSFRRLTKASNPKMNTVLYVFLMETVNAFIDVAIHMELEGRLTVHERTRQLVAGFGDMLLAAFDHAWKTRDDRKANK